MPGETDNSPGVFFHYFPMRTTTWDNKKVRKLRPQMSYHGKDAQITKKTVSL